MTWLWVILGVAVIGGIIGLLINENDAGGGFISGFFGAGMGCAAIIFRIFLALITIYLFFRLAAWLFG